jgi:adenylosuccinate synthase
MDIVNIVDIILGCSFGDEGKGKVVYDLLKNDYDLCVRFNGSGNAGHTIYLDKQKIVVHQLPVGILKPNVYNLISSDCLIHIEKMKKELDEIKSLNINFEGRLFISKACHIITDEAIEYDKNNNTIGTTGSGIGYTYAQKMLRTGKRIEDYREEIEQLGIQLVDMREFWSSAFVKNNIRSVLLEGAQGFELDINWTNNYPFCTSSTCSLAGAINTGIPLKKIRNIFGISKIYDTYVGNMKFQPENDEKLNEIGILGHEYGATTGRKRQCNYLNLDNLKEALKINQCNICIINKVDIIEQLKIFKLYHLGKLIEFTDIDEMKQYIISVLPFLNEIIFSSNPYTI